MTSIIFWALGTLSGFALGYYKGKHKWHPRDYPSCSVEGEDCRDYGCDNYCCCDCHFPPKGLVAVEEKQ